jgi:raffinose/stachyose/melibiose transport system substrate-binding protein
MKPFLGGHEFIKKLKAGTYDFTNPDFIAALKRLKSLTPYFPENYTGLGYSDAQNMTATGQVAMWPGCGSWEVFTLKDINPELELGVFATPVAKKGDPSYVTVFTDQGLALAHTITEKEKEAAIKFLRWMTTPQAGLLMNKYIGFFNCWDNNVFEDEAMKEYAALAGPKGEYIISDWAILLSDGSPTATELIQAGIQELMAGTKTAEQIAQDIQKGLSVWYGKK